MGLGKRGVGWSYVAFRATTGKETRETWGLEEREVRGDHDRSEP